MQNQRSLGALVGLLSTTLSLLFIGIGPSHAQQKSGNPPAAPPAGAKKGDPAQAEESGQSKRDGFVIRTEVNVVNLPVNVRSQEGGFLKSLKKAQFHVYEDGVEQEISLFTQERVPTHLVLLIDISESVRYEWGSIKGAARRFVSQMGLEDRISVVSFNYETRLLQDWTNEPAKIAKALDSVFPKGRTFLWDALYVACDDLLKGVQGKKAIILLSDGFDNCEGGTDIHPKRCVDYMEGLDAAVKSGAIVYVVSEVQALRNQMEYMAKEQGVRPDIPLEPFHNVDLMLRKLAYETGGKVLYPDTFGELGNVYAKVAEELKNQYSLGYVSTNTFKDGTYRKIHVTVEQPGAVVTTRPGYYAPKGPHKG